MQTTRRRFIGITAAISASALLPRSFAQNQNVAQPEPVIWRGVALGADAEIRLYHHDRQHAQYLIEQALQEVSRLEKIFSLYDKNSQISQLNRTGSLKAPALDFVNLMAQAQHIHSLTQGAFDPTVQVLWQQYADYFEKSDNQQKKLPHLPLSLIGLKYVNVSPQKITFAKKHMAITLNGIAQGYITDRVTQILQNAGMPHALVNMGEIRHLDTLQKYPDIAKIKKPRGIGTVPNQTIPLQNKALATSSSYGTVFDAAAQYSHLFNPKTGNNTALYQSVSVLANTAAEADALSTAFAVSSEAQIQAALAKTEAKVWLLQLDGSLKTMG